MIVVLNQRGEIICAPDPQKIYLGYVCRELVGKSAFGLLAWKNAKDLKVRFEWIAVQPGLSVNAVLPVRHKSGHIVRFKVNIRNLLHIEGVRGIVIAARY